MFVRALALHTGTPAQMVASARAADLGWVAIQVIWQHHDHDNVLNLDVLPTYAKALRDADVDVWIWGYPERDVARRIAFANVVGEACAQSGAIGVLIDAEAPYRGATNTQAADLVGRVRGGAPGRLVGLTSYGNVPAFADMPWAGFAETCDLGIPQAYHGQDILGPHYQADAVGWYRDLGFPAIVPALAAWDLSVAQMLEIYARTPTPDRAVIWWDWHNANVHQTWPAIDQARSPETPAALR